MIKEQAEANVLNGQHTHEDVVHYLVTAAGYARARANNRLLHTICAVRSLVDAEWLGIWNDIGKKVQTGTRVASDEKTVEHIHRQTPIELVETILGSLVRSLPHFDATVKEILPHIRTALAAAEPAVDEALVAAV